MRAVAEAAGTTTPTVYERYRNREDILSALRLKTRSELFAALRQTRTLREAFQRQVEFALDNRHAYAMLFDGAAKAPSLHEPWPSFNLVRDRVAEYLGGNPRQHNRLMLALWSLMHGTAILIIRGQFEGVLRAQMIHACLDAFDAILESARMKRIAHSGPKWPVNLILGEGKRSRTGNGRKRAQEAHFRKRRSKKSELDRDSG